MANPTKDQLTINALRERVELLEKKHDRVVTNYNKQIVELGKDVINFDLTLASKDEIINKLEKDFKSCVKLRNEETTTYNEKQFKLIKDLNFCSASNAQKQRTIDALKLENKEVYKQVKIRDYIIGSTLILSAIYLVITLIK